MRFENRSGVGDRVRAVLMHRVCDDVVQEDHDEDRLTRIATTRRLLFELSPSAQKPQPQPVRSRGTFSLAAAGSSAFESRSRAADRDRPSTGRSSLSPPVGSTIATAETYYRRGRRKAHQVCWIAESSQLPSRARLKVHSSVSSLNSPPSTVRPVARSTMLSLSAKLMATVA